MTRPKERKICISTSKYGIFLTSIEDGSVSVLSTLAMPDLKRLQKQIESVEAETKILIKEGKLNENGEADIS